MSYTHPSDDETFAGVPRPLSCPSRSFSFCSRASARRFRKSESATSPTVCVLSRSSAVLLCDVKRGLGVDAPEEVLDAILAMGRSLLGLRLLMSQWDVGKGFGLLGVA